MSENEQDKFNVHCAKLMGWYRGSGMHDTSYYKDTDDMSGTYQCEVCDYDPYNDLTKMMPVVDALVSGLGLHLDSGDVQRHGLLIACRILIAGTLIGDNADYEVNLLDPEELNDMRWETLLMDQRTPVPNCTNFGYDASNNYPNVKEEQEKFNKLCRNIMITHSQNISPEAGLLISGDYDPYYNGNETINIFAIVLQYLPPSINFTMLGRAECDCPSDQNILKRMQDFIRLYGTDDYMLSPVAAFKKLCIALIDGYNIPGCGEYGVEYNPWDNIKDLADIMPVVIEHTPEHPFKIPGAMIDNAIPFEERDNMDMLDNMRFYVQCYGKDVLEMLENGDE